MRRIIAIIALIFLSLILFFFNKQVRENECRDAEEKFYAARNKAGECESDDDCVAFYGTSLCGFYINKNDKTNFRGLQESYLDKCRNKIESTDAMCIKLPAAECINNKCRQKR